MTQQLLSLTRSHPSGMRYMYHAVVGAGVVGGGVPAVLSLTMMNLQLHVCNDVHVNKLGILQTACISVAC